MSKANNSVYGTSYIPPNQLGDADAIASQVVFQGISTLSTFQFVQNGDYLQMFAVSPTLPPVLTTETFLPAYTSIASVIGKTQHMGINDSNTEMLSDLDMNNNNILNANEIDVKDVNLGGHHLTTDSNGNLLVDGAAADAKWYNSPVPATAWIQFNSSNLLSPFNKLYTPNGYDLWYNNTNLTGGGGGGGGEDWATYPAVSNVQIPSPYGLNVGSNAPVATFPTITLCGNTTIGRASAIPFNAPNVEIYPYNFNVGSDLYPALSIELQSGLGGTTIESLEGISLDALIDVNINAGAVIALDATADINLLALGEISMESANMNLIVGGVETTAGTIVDTAATSIIATAPLIEMNGADFNVLSGATTIESATTAITSGAVVITGSATANVISPLTTITGAVLAIQSLATNIAGANVNLYPTANLNMGQIGVPTSIAGSQINMVSPNPVNMTNGLTLLNNNTLKVGNITDWNGSLNIRAANTINDTVYLSNVVILNSVNGANLNNIRLLNSGVAGGMIQTNTKSITFASPTTSQLINLSSITNPNINVAATTNAVFQGNLTQAIGTAELDLLSGSLIKGIAPTITLSATTANITATTTNINATAAVNINAPVVNIPNASHNTSAINCSTITTSTITTNGSIFLTNGNLLIPNGGIQSAGNINAPSFNGANGANFPIIGVPPTFPGTPIPTYIAGAYPCYRYSIPITGLPTTNTIQLNVRCQVQIANTGFPAFYGAGYGTAILMTNASSKYYYRALIPSAGNFPNILDDDQNLCGDLVNGFLLPVGTNSVATTTYPEGVSLAFNYTYKLFGRSEVDIYIDLYGFTLQLPYTLSQLALTTDINYWILS